MNILFLAAGSGKRFKDVGVTTPKPLIKVNGKSILEWTSRSLPFIPHLDISSSIPTNSLYFAILKEHETHDITSALNSIYGSDINIISFEKLTRGNMQTAYMCATLMNADEPLLILDCDNKYNDNNLLETINKAENNGIQDNMIVCYFDPLDQSSKWSFATFSNDEKVKEILEKDPNALKAGGKPLIGTFWFQKTELFLKYSRFLIGNNLMTGIRGKEEFYMSQIPAMHALNNKSVLAHKVTNVVPLGTPEDIEKFKEKI